MAAEPEDSVAVLTDSAASLPPDVVGGPDLEVVPMTVVIGDEAHPDDALSAADVLQVLDDRPVSTSAPSPGDYLRRIEALGGRPVLVTTVARQMSASYEAAVTACRYVRTPTEVVDSGSATGGQGLVVAAGLGAAAAGSSLEAAAAEARRVAGRVRLVAALGGLDRLARSGRVPGIAAAATRSLGLRPIFELAGGRTASRRPAAGGRSALQRLAATCTHRHQGQLRCAVLHADAPGAAAELEAMVLAGVPEARTYVAPFSSVMVAHTGPGVVGLAWWWTPGDDRHADGARRRPVPPVSASAEVPR